MQAHFLRTQLFTPKKIAVQKQSSFSILIIGDGKTCLCQIFTSSRTKVISIQSTARFKPRAVNEDRIEPR